MNVSTDDFQVLTDAALFVVRWRNPSVAGARALSPLVRRHRAEIGMPVFLAVLIGPDCPPPSPQAREVMLREHDQLHELTQAVRIVIIGSGARRALMRSVLTAMTLAASLRGKPFKVDVDVTELIRSASEMLGGDQQALVERMIASGIVSADEIN